MDPERSSTPDMPESREYRYEPGAGVSADAPRSSRSRVLALAALAAAVSLVVGLIGGVTGFVALSSDSSFARTARKALNISQENPLPISTTSRVTLEESSKVIDAAKKVKPAVVSISASQEVEDFFGRVSTQEVSGGTGFIISSDGLIVTNKHVVSDDGVKYKVVLDDGRIFDATVKTTDPLNDLALIKIEGKDLPTVEFGSSDSLEVGQYVIAVGNALGEFSNSVSLGIVSGKGRSITAGSGVSSERLTDVIQTDAAINPGNSGGPLVNMGGQVVGINTAIATSGAAAGSIGIGFSIPIDSVRSIIDSARRTGEIVRPYVGVRYVPITKSYQQSNDLSVDYGALVTAGTGAAQPAVVADSPAEKAGIKSGDILLEVNGERIDEEHPLTNRLQKYQPGDKVTFKTLRDGANQDIEVTLEKLEQ